MTIVTLKRPDDASGFLHALGALLRDGVSPDRVTWHDGTRRQDDLFAPNDELEPAAPEGGTSLTLPSSLPPEFIALARRVVTHDDAERFQRLHDYVRSLQADARTWSDRLDPRRIALERMAHDVGREVHKMHAFVRFRVVRENGDDEPWHVAWHEPAHHVVRAATPFFVKRFASMRWAILTPRGSVRWDRTTLQHAAAASRADAPPADAGEALWIAYYRSIFNPARVKVAMMKKEMPVRFWPNLPEAAAIAPLLRNADARVERMREQTPCERAARRAPQRQHAAREALPEVPLTEDRSAAMNRLRRQAKSCAECAFARDATQTVWGEGPLDAPLMLVGEQPGDREDLEGKPFVGPAGMLLARALASLGWPRERLYLTNAVKHFKYEWRGKRRMHKTAAQREAEQCAQWLEAEIAAVQPQALVALGATAARSLLGRAVSVHEHAGQWLARDDGRPVLVALHPAALLRASSAAPGAPVDAALWDAWLSQLAPAGVWLTDEAPADARSAA
jgi:uracil-DNA glycosylase